MTDCHNLRFLRYETRSPNHLLWLAMSANIAFNIAQG